MPAPDPFDALPEDVAAALRRFSPELASPEHAPLVRGLAAAFLPATVRQARNAAVALSGLVLWAEESGLPVEAEVLLDDDVVNRYLRVGLDGYSDKTRLLVAQRLAQVAAAVTGRRQTSPGARVPADELPYDPTEVDGLLSWAGGLNTPLRRTAALAAAACALGAGLSRAEIGLATGHSVRRAPTGGLLVDVAGERPRTVPVLARYDDLLARLAADAGPNWLMQPARLPPGPDSVNHALGSLPAPGRGPALSLRRARRTWIAEHLTAAVPPHVLAAAAGLATPSLLADYAARLPPQTARDQVRALRHPRSLPPAAVPPPGTAPTKAGAYTPSETDAIVAWARSRTDPVIGRTLRAILFLPLAAGLSQEEANAATGDDIHAAADGTVTITTRGKRPRTVPALTDYDADLLALKHEAGPGTVVPGPDIRRRRPDAVLPHPPRPPAGVPFANTTRARHTWLHRHLLGGTRLDTLLPVAPHDDHRTLDKRIAQLPPLNPHDIVVMLRGPDPPDLRR